MNRQIAEKERLRRRKQNQRQCPRNAFYGAGCAGGGTLAALSDYLLNLSWLQIFPYGAGQGCDTAAECAGSRTTGARGRLPPHYGENHYLRRLPGMLLRFCV